MYILHHSRYIVLLLSLSLTLGCSNPPQESAPGRNSTGGSGNRPEQEAVPVVELAIARPTSLSAAVTYSGTTAPKESVFLRSRSAGQLLSLTIDVGDLVNAGQVVGQVDDVLAQENLREQEAELAARRYTVEELKRSLGEARTEIQRLQAEIAQAQRDADRFRQLATDGAISPQEAEQAQKTVDTLRQSLRGAEEQVLNRGQSIRAAQERVKAQEAIVSRTQEQLSYATLTAPLTGLVMERLVDTGDFVQTGESIVQIGNFQDVVINLDVSDRDLGQLKVGRSAEIRIDAYPDQVFEGTISRIAPVADPNARLIPVEIQIPNPGILLSQGLIARVNFSDVQGERLVIPASALNLHASENPTANATTNEASPDKSTETQTSPKIFILVEQEDKTIVEERSVQLGDRLDDRVVIRSGLKSGESYVIKSNAPLVSGQVVTVSLLSAAQIP